MAKKSYDAYMQRLAHGTDDSAPTQLLTYTEFMRNFIVVTPLAPHDPRELGYGHGLNRDKVAKRHGA